MNEVRRRFLLRALKIFDLVLLVVCFASATILVAYANQRVSPAEFLSIRVKLSNCFIFAAFLAVWYGCFYWCGLYRSRRLSTQKADILDAAKAVALSTACLAFGATLFHFVMVTPRFLVFFWALGTVLVAGSRILLRESLYRARRHGRNLRYLLIIGTNPRAIRFARRIVSAPERGYRLLGFVDDDWRGTEHFRKSGFSVVCGRAGLPEFLRRNVVDEVALYWPLRSFYERASQVAALCEQHGIVIRFDGDVFSLKTAHSRAEEDDGGSYVAAYTGVQEWRPLAIKRVLDVVISALALAALAPLFGVVALLIHFTSEGRIFYFQERVGLNKRRFLICKFRTMIPHADKMLSQLETLNEASGPVFKIKDDPRITPVGKFLRRTSIDELPQLWNVLKGDMSLVGPRPLPVRDYEGFDKDWQRRRFSVRPGITCLWQINGRSTIPFEQWMELDLQYMDEWSLWLDLKILVRTIPAVLRGSGAA
ncbi:MAG TPA: sugar transferase [Candidatus Baltobacteraceae bacterium]|nr:sugar transferase [Candidatus Baltobacteraceae bacterium]